MIIFVLSTKLLYILCSLQENIDKRKSKTNCVVLSKCHIYSHTRTWRDTTSTLYFMFQTNKQIFPPHIHWPCSYFYFYILTLFNLLFHLFHVNFILFFVIYKYFIFYLFILLCKLCLFSFLKKYICNVYFQSGLIKHVPMRDLILFIW